VVSHLPGDFRPSQLSQRNRMRSLGDVRRGPKICLGQTVTEPMSLTRQALRDVGRREAKRRVREIARGASRKDRRKLERAINKVAWDRRDRDAIEYLKAKTEATAAEVKAALA
jgi:hypothetical protein